MEFSFFSSDVKFSESVFRFKMVSSSGEASDFIESTFTDYNNYQDLLSNDELLQTDNLNDTQFVRFLVDNIQDVNVSVQHPLDASSTSWDGNHNLRAIVPS